MIDRMPPLAPEAMTPAQQAAAAALIAGPRKGVFGPFIPLLRSPELMDRLQRVGEYLRFGSVMPAKLNELAMLVTARHVTNQFEWVVHHPLAIKAGVAAATVEAIGRGERPRAMPEDEALLLWLPPHPLRADATEPNPERDDVTARLGVTDTE